MVSLLEQMNKGLKDDVTIPNTHLKVNFLANQLRILRAPWSKTLMGKVLGSMVRYDVLTLCIPLLWKPQGKLDIIDICKNFSYLNLIYDLILNVLYLVLVRALFNANPMETKFSTFTKRFLIHDCLVRFPELPVAYFNKTVLFDIAKLVGVLLKLILLQTPLVALEMPEFVLNSLFPSL